MRSSKRTKQEYKKWQIHSIKKNKLQKPLSQLKQQQKKWTSKMEDKFETVVSTLRVVEKKEDSKHCKKFPRKWKSTETKELR